MSDTLVIRFMNKVTDLLLLNLLWILTSLPIITIGASTTAMFYVSIRSIRQGDGYVWKNFWRAFRRDFRQATIVWIVMLLFMISFVTDLYLLNYINNKIVVITSRIFIGIFSFLYLMIGLYIFPVIAKFENTLKVHIKNAALMSIGHFKHTLIILIFTMAFLYVNYVSLYANVFGLLIGVALFAYIVSFFYYSVFMNYMEERYDDFDKIEN